MSKNKLAVIFLISTFAVSSQSFSQSSQSKAAQAAAESDLLANVVDVPSPTPRGPQDLVQDYSEGMQSITQQFSGRLAAIAGAVQRGELTSEQGESISAEQYEAAQMQFNLLAALREITEQDIARAAAATRPAPATSEQKGIVMVALPFSSLQLNPSIIEYLDLSQAQVESIEKLMSDERSSLAPLMAQMQETKDQLVSVTEQGQTKDNKEIKALAATQAQNLTKLILANSQMRIKIYQLLSPTQQKKLDEFQRQ